MPTYFVRLELNDVPKAQSAQIYRTLHTAMAKGGFLREIEQEGKKFKLPTGLYVRTTKENLSALVIDTNAHIIATEVWTEGNELFTVKAEKPEDFYSVGLEEIS